MTTTKTETRCPRNYSRLVKNFKDGQFTHFNLLCGCGEILINREDIITDALKNSPTCFKCASIMLLYDGIKNMNDNLGRLISLMEKKHEDRAHEILKEMTEHYDEHRLEVASRMS